MLSIGIVGLPNVGKSTLFKALTKKSVAISNYPFTTIKPNVGIVEVPDKRLESLGELSHSQKITPAMIEFIDIAGLVKNAAQGEGLGNQFLAHIREVDLIVHLVRVFQDSHISHVHNRIDPANDTAIINTELLLADMHTLDNYSKRVQKNPKENKKEGKWVIGTLEKWKQHIGKGTFLGETIVKNEEKKLAKMLNLLTAKPFLYVLNVSEKQLAKKFYPAFELKNALKPYAYVILSANMELEIGGLDREEQKEYLKSLHLTESGLDQLIQRGYGALNLISFLTTGEKETRAWTITRGTNAQKAAGVIHTDFEKTFVKAELINWEKLLAIGSWQKARDLGKLTLAGKNYIMQDGDVVEFKHGAP